MDAERRIIPIVEDDQGEGIKDPLDEVPGDYTLEEKIDGIENALKELEEVKKSSIEVMREKQEEIRKLKRIKSRFKKAGYNH